MGRAKIIDFNHKKGKQPLRGKKEMGKKIRVAHAVAELSRQRVTTKRLLIPPQRVNDAPRKGLKRTWGPNHLLKGGAVQGE